MFVIVKQYYSGRTCAIYSSYVFLIRIPNVQVHLGACPGAVMAKTVDAFLILEGDQSACRSGVQYMGQQCTAECNAVVLCKSMNAESAARQRSSPRVSKSIMGGLFGCWGGLFHPLGLFGIFTLDSKGSFET